MGVVDVPSKATFWQNYRHAFRIGSVDEASEHCMVYVGSAAGKDGTRGRITKQHENVEYRQKSPTLFYAAMDEPGASRSWRQIGVNKQDEDCQAHMRITEALAIATLHTYTSTKYTAMLKEYGVVEKGSEAFGFNRTGAVKDFVSDGNSALTSAFQRIMHQVLLERYGGPRWTYDNLPDIIREWLTEEGFGTAKINSIAS